MIDKIDYNRQTEVGDVLEEHGVIVTKINEIIDCLNFRQAQIDNALFEKANKPSEVDGKCPECHKGKYVNGDTCRKCNGMGLLPQDECDDCNGTGKIPSKETIRCYKCIHHDGCHPMENAYECKDFVEIKEAPEIKFSPETYPPNKLPKEQTLTLEETVITALGLCIDHVDYKAFAGVIRGWMKERIFYSKLSGSNMIIALKALECE